MNRFRFATKFMVVTLSIALLAVPAFAATAELAQTEQSALTFHALSGMAADTPTLLTDEQLASVEGGHHLVTAATFLIEAIFLAQAATVAPNLTSRFILFAFANADRAMAAFLLGFPVHSCFTPSAC